MAQLVETCLWEAAAPGDAEGGIVRDVKILGQKSRNKRFYTEQAMQSAVELYEGRPVYISHAGEKVKHRPATERYGRLTGVRYDASRKQLRGDLVYLESQQLMTAMMKEDIQRQLNFFGLSHVADGQWYMKEGVQVVTEIERVTSVDLVSDPATATSLREQEDAPAAPAEPNPADAAMSDAFSQAVLAVLQDATLDVPGKVAKIQQILESHEEITKPKEEGAKEEPAKEQTDATAIKALVEQAVTAALAKAKPKKYLTPAPGTSQILTEQTDPTTTVDAPPKDKAALKKWLMK